MDLPTRQQALSLLQTAYSSSPGAWMRHSFNVGRAAQTIAAHCGMDSNFAHIMGLLHDIGRYEGVSNIHHIICGYNFMMDKGYTAIARVCLTHSFPIKDINASSGQMDCNQAEISFIQAYLEQIEYDDYDRLIQLCDALADAKGIVFIEMRLMDVAKRRGINSMTVAKWNAFDSLKKYFSEKCGTNIYSLFYDELCKNLFEY